jgi:hypothetical protein
LLAVDGDAVVATRQRPPDRVHLLRGEPVGVLLAGVDEDLQLGNPSGAGGRGGDVRPGLFAGARGLPEDRVTAAGGGEHQLGAVLPTDPEPPLIVTSGHADPAFAAVIAEAVPNAAGATIAVFAGQPVECVTGDLEDVGSFAGGGHRGEAVLLISPLHPQPAAREARLFEAAAICRRGGSCHSPISPTQLGQVRMRVCGW